MLLFNGSLGIGMCGPGMIHEEIHHLGGISQVLEISDGVHTGVLKVPE